MSLEQTLKEQALQNMYQSLSQNYVVPHCHYFLRQNPWPEEITKIYVTLQKPRKNDQDVEQVYNQVATILTSIPAEKIDALNLKHKNILEEMRSALNQAESPRVNKPPQA